MGPWKCSTLLPLPAVLCILSVILAVGNGEQNPSGLSETECREMGFNPDNLLCSSCDMLDRYELSQIRSDCSKCCNEISYQEQSFDKSVKKYPKAILEVCNCKMGVLPYLKDFLKSDKRRNYPSLVQKHVDGAWPSISLINDDGRVDQTFSITKWNGETITEFLDTYLVNSN